MEKRRERKRRRVPRVRARARARARFRVTGASTCRQEYSRAANLRTIRAPRLPALPFVVKGSRLRFWDNWAVREALIPGNSRGPHLRNTVEIPRDRYGSLPIRQPRRSLAFASRSRDRASNGIGAILLIQAERDPVRPVRLAIDAINALLRGRRGRRG